MGVFVAYVAVALFSNITLCLMQVVAEISLRNGVGGSLTVIVLKTLMVGHGGSSAGSYLADPTSPIPSHCAAIKIASVVTQLKLRGGPLLSATLFNMSVNLA